MTVPYSIMSVYKNLCTNNTLVYKNLYNTLKYIYVLWKKIILWMCHHTTLKKFKLQNYGPIVLIKVSTIVLKEGRSERGYNPETPYNFSYQSSMMSTGWTRPPKLWLAGTAIWWGYTSFILLAGSGQQQKSLDWTILEVTLGPNSERPVYGSWVLSVGITWGQGLWHLPQPMEESRWKAYVEDNGKLGLGLEI